MGAVLVVLFGNNLLPLVAMTRSHVEDCQMACCKFRHRHTGNSTGDSCPLMNMGSSSHESMMAMEQSDAEKSDSKKQQLNFFEHKFFKTENIHLSIDNHQLHAVSDETKTSPFFNIKFAERCDQTTCGANSFSNSGKRQQQSSDDCGLLTFADKPRPPTSFSVIFKTEINRIVSEKRDFQPPRMGAEKQSRTRFS